MGSCISAINIALNSVNGTILGSPFRNLYNGIMVRPAMTTGEELKVSNCLGMENITSCCLEMATESEVASVPEFKHVCKNFPVTIENWDTLLLIGRDNVWAMVEWEEITTGKRNFPVATKTALGWSLLGPKVLSSENPPRKSTVSNVTTVLPVPPKSIEKVLPNHRLECSWCRVAKKSYAHDPIDCEVVKQYDMDSLEKFVDRKRLCFVCLQPGHTEDTCSRIKNRCESCQVPHSELLPHTDDRPEVFVDTMTNFVRIVQTHRARRGGINYPFSPQL